MNQVRRMAATILAQMGKLTASQKLLVGSLGVIAAMSMFFVLIYASDAEVVELMPGGDATQQSAALEQLRATSIKHQVKDGRVYVSSAEKPLVIAQMAQNGRMPGSTALFFDDVLERQSWTMGADQRKQYDTIARQNTLASILASFRGVRSANVILDIPNTVGGFGAAARAPTAAVVLHTVDGRGLSQTLVDAAARTVAGAVERLTIENVSVADGAGVARRPTTDDERIGGTYGDLQGSAEREYTSKILGALGHIDGVTVSVNVARVEARRQTVDQLEYLPGEGGGSVSLVATEKIMRAEDSRAVQGAEPGVMPNTGASIATGEAQGNTSTRSDSQTTFDSRFGSKRSAVVDPGGAPLKVNATVQVPRSYFVALWRMRTGAEPDAEPEPADLDSVVTEETEGIRQDVLLMVEAGGVDAPEPGEVRVAMAMDRPGVFLAGYGAGAVFGGPSGSGNASGGGGIGGVLASGLVKQAVLGLLAVVSVFMMASSLKKAGKPIELPSASELVGVPEAMNSDGVVGEAGEMESAMDGVEISENELQGRDKLDQVLTLVGEKPQVAARLITKWIEDEDD